LTEREKWLEERKSCIGGSDASAVVGLNSYKTNVELWKEKTGLVIPEDIGNKPAVKYGVDAEPLLRELFKLDFAQYEVSHNEFKIHRHPKYNFIGSTLDGELYDMLTGERGILEIKTSTLMRSSQLDDWQERIPTSYYIQILHQLLCTQWDFAILKAHLRTNWNDEVRITTKHYTIKRSEVQVDIDFLEESIVKFWTQYVVTNIEPPLILPNI